MITDKRILTLTIVTALATIGMFAMSPIKQDIAYHAFADTRTIVGLPNFFNVVSNLPFLIIGVAGVRRILVVPIKPAHTIAITAYLLFFVGLALTGLGSAYYHFQPNNTNLVWDRLPMTLSFMAFFCLVVAECISDEIAKRLLLPLLALGVTSVIYWHISELRGQGDLRPYILVQFLPVALLPAILWLFDGADKKCRYVWAVLGAYALAKVAESLDLPIFNALHLLSGHSLKHLLAGLGTYFVYLRLIKQTFNG